MRDVEYLGTAYLPGQEPTYYIIKVPASLPRWREHIRSLQWFNHRELKRAFGDEKATARSYQNLERYTTVKILPDPMWELESAILISEGVTIAEVEGAWNFYLQIGYDRDRQKYIR